MQVELKGMKNKFYYAARINDTVLEDSAFKVTYLEKKGSIFDLENLCDL